MASIATMFLLLSLSFLCVSAQQKHPTIINLGTTISPSSDKYPRSWPSPSGLFEFGFYDQAAGNGRVGFAIGVWLVGVDQITVVWTANRDHPLIASNATTLTLEHDGTLWLVDENGNKSKLIANDALPPATSASMLDDGNFVLYHKSQRIWESFDYPTDTIVGGQVLHSGGQLFSSISETDHSTGRFHLNMQKDGNLVLYPVNNEDTGIDAYWSSGTYNNAGFNLYLYLNKTSGNLAIINGTNHERVTIVNDQDSYSSDVHSSHDNETVQNGTVYRATLNANGIFRLYSHAINKTNGSAGEPNLLWWALKDPCEVKGFCGFNSFCTFFDDQPNCLCLPGSDFVDSSKKTLGCLRNYSDVGCIHGKENITLYGLNQMENVNCEDFPYSVESMSMEDCKNSCLEDCNCGAAFFQRGFCNKRKLPLRYVRRQSSGSNEYSTNAFFKVGKNTTNEAVNETLTNMNMMPPREQVITSKNDLTHIIVLALGLVIFSCVSIAISCFYISKIRVLRYKRLRDIKGQFGILLTDQDHEDLTLRVFSYYELKRATSGFKEELGRGSFGAVYRGSLNKGRKLVAVKRLEKLIDEGEREFRAEMRAIGRTNHKNLVRLIGYCVEDSKRLLVYEYMSNGSLADLLFKQAQRPYWEERVRIAIDVAKGIHYLHEECKSPIIHCDIKPQNILMDDFWTAKISDFGLAKLLMPDQTRTFTGVRGTRGYLAPEWHKNTPVTVKADVYSYGIVLLEIICCRRNLEINVPNVEELVLSSWVYKCFADRELDKLVVGEDQVERRTLENMVKVGLWCIQDEQVLRPSMKSVVLMLEGITDIASPPCPTSSSSV
ncbi:hypothetical protein FNV43_RR18832 [Rhamnella rubrinervis]|uniref:Receptor-like serine/threonine-protein kinase n=1 Tax=Rhamnella rubrinervis TaxID=2594499 RepID=A0A8K0GWQ6_9ROSA|nr:hypothetical protein FNV43_RR18832 [Rhamnella rubrinervis]